MSEETELPKLQGFNNMGAERLHSPYTENDSPETIQRLEHDDRAISAWHPWRTLESIGVDSFQIEDMEQFGRDIEADARFFLAVTVPANGSFPKADPQTVKDWHDLLEVKFEGWEMHMTDKEGNTEKRDGSVIARRRTTYHALPDGSIGGIAGGEIIILEDDAEFGERWQAIKRRNERLGIETPEGLTPFYVGDGTPPVYTEEKKGKREIVPRKGKRVLATPALNILCPTAQPARAAISLIGAGIFRNTEDGMNIYAKNSGGDEVAFRVDPSLNVTAEAFIKTLARTGPSVVQTFLAMAGLWLQKRAGEPYNTYLEASVTDLLKFMGRKPKDKDGFDNEDILPRGVDVCMLSFAWVPTARITQYGKNKSKTKTSMTLKRLVIIEEIGRQDCLDLGEARQTPSIVTFKYHLPEDLYKWLRGAEWQAATISSRLLRYHPVRQKFPILLGLALAYYQRVNNRPTANGYISLPALLKMAAIETDGHFDQRLKQIISALDTLADHGIIPGLRLTFPLNRENLSAQQILNSELTRVIYDVSPAVKTALLSA